MHLCLLNNFKNQLALLLKNLNLQATQVNQVLSLESQKLFSVRFVVSCLQSQKCSSAVEMSI